MSKSKLTLVVDGNWLLMSRMSVLNARYADDEQMCKDLKIMMIKSINIVLRTFPAIDNIIFVSDGGSWRNKLEAPKFLQEQGIEYKGNREKSDNVNWDAIFSAYEDFITKLNQNGITAVKETGIEGDDWCWYWSTKLNKEGTNVIIWSKDKDLTQLVKTDRDGCFTVCWNKDSGVTTTLRDEGEMDFLFNMQFNINEEIYRSIVDKSKEVNQITPKDVVVDKIIRGDAGDNVLPIILRKSKSGSDKQYRVSPKDIDSNLDIHNEAEVRTYVENLLESKSYKGRVDKPITNIIEHFEYNKKLVALEKDSYPQEILDIMNKYQTYNCSKDTHEIEYQLTAEANQIGSVLDFI